MKSLQDNILTTIPRDVNEQIREIGIIDRLHLQELQDRRLKCFQRHNNAGNDLTIDAIVPFSVGGENEPDVRSRTFDLRQPVNILIANGIRLGKWFFLVSHSAFPCTVGVRAQCSHKLFSPSVLSLGWSAPNAEHGYRPPSSSAAGPSFERGQLIQTLIDIFAMLSISALMIVTAAAYLAALFILLFVRL